MKELDKSDIELIRYLLQEHIWEMGKFCGEGTNSAKHARRLLEKLEVAE